MKRRRILNRLRKRAIRYSQQFGLPEDVLTGLPRVVMHGNTSLSLENNNGVLEYSSAKIRVKTDLDTLTITGDGMSLRKMGRHDMLLSGTIKSVTIGD